MLGSLRMQPVAAQQPLRLDAAALINSITELPPTVEAFHSLFTRQTKHGEEFVLALTDPPLLNFRQQVCAIHDSGIRAIMQKAPRKDMTDSIQYEDERWKLALRPFLGADVKAKLIKADARVKPVMLQIFEMQSVFDWVDYYKQEEKVKKAFREKEAAAQSAVSEDNSTAIAKAKVDLDIQQYEKRQQMWMDRYSKYSRALISLQQLMESIRYGEGLPPEDKKLVDYVLSDVQARALEAHEKLVWNEISVAIHGELTFNGMRIVAMFTGN